MDISKLKIKELEALLAENPASELLTALQQDARASARRLAESYQKRQAKKLAEEARLQAMYQYEEQAASQGYRAVDRKSVV